MSVTVMLGTQPVSAAEVVAVARDGARVELAAGAREAMALARARVEALDGAAAPAYGVSTGFGSLATVPIPPQDRRTLQLHLIRSHAAGMGPPIEREVVRAMMLLRARTLARGYSGTRPAVADALAGLLNAQLTPVVPEHGSLGCSGDLAPLAHIALALLGEGEVADAAGHVRDAGAALAEIGQAPLVLEAKEGLALINGTDGMLGLLLLACADARTLFATADVTAAMTVEALSGTDRPFAADLQALRPHPGQAASAANLRRLLAGSGLVGSAPPGEVRVQDAYSLRCAPQVAGAARDTLTHVEGVGERELAAVVDNPVVLPDSRMESTGHFHGAPLGFACDFLAIAAAEVGAIAERRVDRMLDITRSHGLPAFLADRPGVDSGLMIAQYTAAGLVAENRRLAAPASVDSLPTSAMQEDHNSMGWGAARKLRTVLENLGRILAVELVVAARALDLRAPLTPAPATAAVRDGLRAHVPGPGPDRHLAPELAAAERLVASGVVLDLAAAGGEPLR
jgi:histidine ammonia-lyase